MENSFNHHLVVSRQQIQRLFLAVILAVGIAGAAQAQVTATISRGTVAPDGSSTLPEMVAVTCA